MNQCGINDHYLGLCNCFDINVAQEQHRLDKAYARLRRLRERAGLCRHCGGPIPCDSLLGDRAVGVWKTMPEGYKLDARA